MNTLSSCAALVALACTSMASAQSDVSYVLRGNDLMQVSGTFEYRVDMKVITVKLVDGVDDWNAFLQRLDGEAQSVTNWKALRHNRLGFIDIELDADSHPLAAVELLRDTGLVELAEVNTIGTYGGVPNDASFGQQWGLLNVGQSGGTAGADMNVTPAWGLTGGASDVVIAVLDSGTEHTHPDLQGNIWQNTDEIAGNGVDDDANGFIDDTIGWDFDVGDNNPDGGSHGTNVAGCAGGIGNNGIGVAGVAGGGDNGGESCPIMPLSVGAFFPNGAVLDDALLYAADNGASIITMSLSVAQSSAIDAAITAAHDDDVFIDCAAGNNGFSVAYPANLPRVMAVASTNRFDNVSGFSNAGPEVEIAAPGEDIFTTATGNNYTTTSGTSFSAPHLAGVAGLVRSVNGSLTNEQVRQVLIDTAVDVAAPGFDNDSGHGRVDAAAAVTLASGGMLASVVAYGDGLSGLGGLTPLAGSNGGSPTVGNDNFVIRVARARPNADATLIVGFGQAATPFKGGTLHVDLSGNFVLTGVTTAANGSAVIPAPLPSDPMLAGVMFNAQWAIQDVAAVAGLSLSNGLEISIGS